MSFNQTLDYTGWGRQIGVGRGGGTPLVLVLKFFLIYNLLFYPLFFYVVTQLMVQFFSMGGRLREESKLFLFS